MSKIRKDIYFTDFDLKGCSNYAFNIILRKKNSKLFKKLCENMKKNSIEFRVGGAGGGNQLRQPYIKNYLNNKTSKIIKSLKNTDHIHFFGFYVGNYPYLKKNQLNKLINILNNI